MNRNRKFKQLYGRLDMVDLDRHEKYYGSLGLADPFTIETKQGNPLLLDGTKERPFEGMRIFGKSTQDGTPSPENPVPIVSAGDNGEINVSVSDGGTQSQTLTLSTPGGLPGIPVSSGGNYTDESGQQWICDEIDFKRGKYVRRIATYLIDRCTRNINNKRQQDPEYFGLESSALSLSLIGYSYFCLSNKLVYAGNNSNINGSQFTIVRKNGAIVFGLKKSLVSEETAVAVRQYLRENPIEIIYVLLEPIETPLPAEEIAAYKTLRTYSPTTTVSNDADTEMEIKYKKYPIGGMS